MSEVKRTIDEDDVARLRAVSLALARAQKRSRSRWIAESAESLRLVILRLDARKPVSALALAVDETVSDLRSDVSDLTDAVRSIEQDLRNDRR